MRRAPRAAERTAAGADTGHGRGVRAAHPRRATSPSSPSR
jgi:hypothetical protein